MTVIMSVHNGLPYVRESVRSVLAQDWRDFELIVVDDGSTDGTADALAEVEDARLRVVRSPRVGRVAALNAAVALAQGRYVANLDADDLALTNRLSAPIRFLDVHADVAAVGAGVQPTFGTRGRRRPRRLPRTDLGIRWQFLVRNPTFHSSMTYRADVLRALGGYDLDYEDYDDDADLLLRIARRHRLANLPCALAVKRLHPAQFFAQGDRRKRVARQLSCRRRAPRELGFPPLVRPVAHALAAAACVRLRTSLWRAERSGHPVPRSATTADNSGG